MLKIDGKLFFLVLLHGCIIRVTTLQVTGKLNFLKIDQIQYFAYRDVDIKISDNLSNIIIINSK